MENRLQPANVQTRTTISPEKKPRPASPARYHFFHIVTTTTASVSEGFITITEYSPLTVERVRDDPFATLCERGGGNGPIFFGIGETYPLSNQPRSCWTSNWQANRHRRLTVRTETLRRFAA